MAEPISITICGDGGCGKSSITLRLVRSQWIHEYDPTIEDLYSVTRTVDGIPYCLSITDTAGQEEYRGLWTAATLASDAFLLVYDITNPDSLQALDHFIALIDMEAEQRIEDNARLRRTHPNVPLPPGLHPPPVRIVVGNKCDLKEGRAVPSRDGLAYARARDCGFMETSARELVNIEETFALLVRRVVEARQKLARLPENTLRPPPSRAGTSIHTTALPPTTADASIGSAEKESRCRSNSGFRSRSRLRIFGRKHPLGGVEFSEDHTKQMTLGSGPGPGQGQDQEQEGESRGSQLRRLWCCCV